MPQTVHVGYDPGIVAKEALVASSRGLKNEKGVLLETGKEVEKHGYRRPTTLPDFVAAISTQAFARFLSKRKGAKCDSDNPQAPPPAVRALIMLLQWCTLTVQ